MTLDEATDLATRTLAAINARGPFTARSFVYASANRERVASDLAGVRWHGPDDSDGLCYRDGEHPPCFDAARCADGLRRTAALYGVAP